MKSYLKLIFGILIFVIFSLLLLNMYKQNQVIIQYKSIVGSLEKERESLKVAHEDYQKKAKNLRSIKIFADSPNSKHVLVGDVIYEYSNKVDGYLSIYYKNLTTGESVIIDGERDYYMASLYKVILTVYILDKVKSGEIQLADKIGDPPITVEMALNKIISESNNEYAQILAEEYGWKNIEEYIKQKFAVDFTFDSKLEANVVNMGKVFESIALSLELTDTQSNYLLSLLKEQKRISKLPKYLPQNIYTHNKTGEYEDFSHDAAIIYTPKANYILIFMSKTINQSSTNEQMANMSQKVYEVLNDVVGN